MSDPLTIRKLVDRIASGDIRIPAFQRDFVWEPEQVAFLLDSIYKEFPIGTIILWRTDSRLKTEKKLGHFVLPAPQKDYPVNYVLDGQQRLTSLFSVFQTELQPESKQWVDIYFDILAEESLQESLFIALEDGEVDLARHFPIKTLFDTVEYRKATERFKDVPEKLQRLDELQSKFKEYLIPNETFESDDRNKVAIVFERINRAGTDLNVFELLSAWSWSEEFDLVGKFAALQDELADHGFEELGDEKELLLRICAGVIAGETTPKAILDLKGEEIRNRFQEIQSGIIGALDFLKREVNVGHYKMLPFPAALVPLSAYFATDKPEGKNYSDKQKQQLIRWFWRAMFSKRYSSDVNQRQAIDIGEMHKLGNDEHYDLKHQRTEIRLDFQKDTFSTANANGKIFILLLASMAPHSFLSGAKIEPVKVLKKASKHEFHHIFPQKYLEEQKVDQRRINSLANICFLTRADNNKIKARGPALYVSEMEATTKSQYLSEAFCPANLQELDYDGFLTRRELLLLVQATELTATPLRPDLMTLLERDK